MHNACIIASLPITSRYRCTLQRLDLHVLEISQRESNCRGSRSRPGDELPDDCKLYVGNLSHVITDTVLKQVFEPFGNVLHAVVLMDMTTNQSRGYGFVHMDNATSAANAARGMSGKVCCMHASAP